MPLSIHAGEMIHVPANLPYGFKAVGSELGKLLLITSSQEFEPFLAEIGTPVTKLLDNSKEKNTVSAARPSRKTMEEIAAIARKHGIEFFN